MKGDTSTIVIDSVYVSCNSLDSNVDVVLLVADLENVLMRFAFDIFI